MKETSAARARPPMPEEALWIAIGESDGLRRVLEVFYARVYADARLAPFFVHVTRDRAIEKQYSFLRQLFTGEPIYFGDRPRNAHHWMVISDELFDYREELMMTCLREAGIAEAHRARWRALEERFRKQIVKDAPRPKRVRGEDLPLEGWDSVVLPMGTLCAEAVDAGHTLHDHVRTGRGLCARCHSREAGEGNSR